MIKMNITGKQEVLLKDTTGKETIYNIDDELMVNDNNYQQEYLRQAQKYSFWSDKLAISDRQVSGASQQADLLHAKLYKKYFLELTKAKMRPTKDMVESEIVQDSSYQAALTNLEQARFVEEKLKFIVKAFEQRKDMLIQFGAEMRKDK